MCRVTPNNHKVVYIYIYICLQYIPRIMETNTRLYSVLKCTVHVSSCRRFCLSTFWSVDVFVCRRFGLSTFRFVDVLVCRRFGLSTFWSVDVSVCRRFGPLTFWSVDVLVCRRYGLSTFWSVDVLGWWRFGLSTFRFVDVLVCRRFGLSTFWFVDVLVCRRFDLSTFWSVDVLVCRRFGLSTFRCVDVSACRRFGCRHFGLSMFWPVTYKRIHFNTSKPGYKYGHHFADDIFKWISWLFYNLALHEFYFLNMIYVLVYIDLILSAFFQHSNILTRASHHWCLASNIVLV